MYKRPTARQSRNLPPDLSRKALISSAMPEINIMIPTTNTVTLVAKTTLDSAQAGDHIDDAERDDPPAPGSQRLYIPHLRLEYTGHGGFFR
jgi:hypothetical protein